MPIVIQDCVTGKFAAPGGRWTKNVSKALRFEQVLRAWDEIDERALSGVRILLWPQAESSGILMGSVQERSAAPALAM